MDLYKLKQDLIQVPVAQMIYDLYRYTYPLKQVLPLDKKSKKFQPSFIEGFLRSLHADLADQNMDFSEEHIGKLVDQHGLKKTKAHLDYKLEECFDHFDQDKIDEINAVYSSFLGFARFAYFDFFPILREFDLHLEEGNFAKKPSFSPAEGSLLRDDLLDLHRAIHSFPVDDSIDRSLKVFKQLRNVEPISSSSLSKLKKLLRTLQEKDYIALIVRGIDRDANPLPVTKPFFTNIFDKYGSKLKSDVPSVINAITKKMRD
jgi:hypothetical protein